MKVEQLRSLEQLFERHGHAEQAVQMKAYMKNLFEFYGIKSTERRELQLAFLAEHGEPLAFDMALFESLWDAEQREYQYFGLDMMRKQAKKVEEKDLALIEKLIISKSWWDTVDGLASWVCGPYFLKFPQKMKPTTNAWAESENMWLRRTSILFQLGYKQKTNTNLLFDHIEKNLGTKAFFINKAIGWSLREYAKTDAQLVADYVKQMESKLHPLSIREALKHL